MKQMIKLITFIFLCNVISPLWSYMPNQVQAILQSLQKPGAKINCAGCDLRGVVDLVGLDMRGIFMPGVVMQPCLPTDTNKNSFMICVPKQPTNLTGSNLSQAVLFSSCLDGVILYKADLTGADVTGSSLEYANLQDAIVKDIKFDGANFCHAIMPDGTLCTDSWTGQGITIDCNCAAAQSQASADIKKNK